MKITGIIVHQSACASINGKGYDFYITKTGNVIPASEPTDEAGFLHVCLEGDFSASDGLDTADGEEQFFVAAKLIAELASTFGFTDKDLRPHHDGCPGGRFPWRKLVLSISDGYH
ncbi:hypothetical protein MO973_08365 [Paenibacillus sp. TRM 82003]|nr:hypothetical protein [Paenibacillus sp. TRM 82003]